MGAPPTLPGGGGVATSYGDPHPTSTTYPSGILPSPTGPPSVVQAPLVPPTQVTSPFDSDPGYAAQRAAEQLGIPSINNNLNNLIAQRIVAYGDPALAAQAGFGLDPQAAAFAQQNYLSGNGQLARLDKAHAQARQTIINTLAAHGLIDSGDTGYQIGNADQTYGNGVYDAQQQALADILGYRNNAQTQRDALHAATIQALEGAFTNYANNPAAYGQTTNSAPPPVTSAAPPRTPTVPKPAAHKAVVKALVNPYATGQKRFG